MGKTVSGVLFATLLLLTVIPAVEVRRVRAWSGTVYIVADGSVSPPDSPVSRNGDLYTLTGNIYSDGDGIVILRNNVTLTGAGYAIQGTAGAYSRGIYIQGRNNITIRETHVSAFEYGLVIDQSSGVVVEKNTFSENLRDGVSFHEASFNMLLGNRILNNENGIELAVSNNNSICTNNIEANLHYGIGLCSSENNHIYHNSFVANTYLQASPCANLTNTWHEIYPLCGNYWSDYNGTDLRSGFFQNETNSDGIGDTLYFIDENNTDRYPLMGQWTEAGENTTVTHPSGFSLVYSNVLFAGVTIINQSELGPQVSLGFRHASQPPIYYDIKTFADFSAPIILAIVYDGHDLTQLEEERLNLVRWNHTLQEWENITTHVDTANDTISGETSSLSMFTLVIPILGDINSDGIVDIYDAITLASAFGSRPGSSNWNYSADINSDGGIDIYDAIILAGNYGENS